VTKPKKKKNREENIVAKKNSLSKGKVKREGRATPGEHVSRIIENSLTRPEKKRKKKKEKYLSVSKKKGPGEPQSDKFRKVASKTCERAQDVRDAACPKQQHLHSRSGAGRNKELTWRENTRGSQKKKEPVLEAKAF